VVPPLRYRAAMSDRSPLAVLVGGAPGSGKTTLAEALGVGLDLPVLHKDSLVHGRWRTLEQATELGTSGIEPFYRSMELWIEAGISFVAEQTFYPEVSEADVTGRLAPQSFLVNVHCRSSLLRAVGASDAQRSALWQGEAQEVGSRRQTAELSATTTAGLQLPDRDRHDGQRLAAHVGGGRCQNRRSLQPARHSRARPGLALGE
jgi:hypothetical protein